MDFEKIRFYWGCGLMDEERLLKKTGFNTKDDLRKYILEGELKELGYDKDIYRRRKQSLNIWSATVEDYTMFTTQEIKERTGMYPNEIKEWFKKVDIRLMKLGREAEIVRG